MYHVINVILLELSMLLVTGSLNLHSHSELHCQGNKNTRVNEVISSSFIR